MKIGSWLGKIKKRSWYILVVFVIGILMSTTDLFKNIFDVYDKLAEKSEGFEIVDVGIVPTNDSTETGDWNYANGAKIDIKLRNISKNVAFVKEAVIRIKSINYIHITEIHCPAADGFTESGSYMVNLDLAKRSDTIYRKVSQVIQSGAADRFSLIFATTSELTEDRIYIVRLAIDLVYNENSKIESTKDIVFAVRSSTLIFCQPFIMSDQILRHLDQFKDVKEGEIEHYYEFSPWEGKTGDLRPLIVSWCEDHFNLYRELHDFSGVIEPELKQTIEGLKPEVDIDTIEIVKVKLNLD
ncbi:hypothetical protein [Chryseolinea soli]|uniref:Uncharacterized protein n=1 Tax=Chryseolinea soli TaxID=2321403 RepID=A0A385SYD6_9BACT|nr:hypothetical protein [Chryseolinea soli]AYB34750.1 hypothetical protein D4L85_31055 [Chryseolinea soli]